MFVHVIQMADEWDLVTGTRYRGDVVDPKDCGDDSGVRSINVEKQEPDMVQDEESSRGRCCDICISK